MAHLMRSASYAPCSGWRCAPSAGQLHRHLRHAPLGVGAYFRQFQRARVRLVMSPHVRVLCEVLWRSLSSEGVSLRCGLQTRGLLREVCVVLCSRSGHGMVPLASDKSKRSGCRSEEGTSIRKRLTQERCGFAGKKFML